MGHELEYFIRRPGDIPATMQVLGNLISKRLQRGEVVTVRLDITSLSDRRDDPRGPGGAAWPKP